MGCVWRALGCSRAVFAAVAAVAALASGCGKKEHSSNVRLQFPDWTEMRRADLERQSKVSTLSDEFNIANVDMVVVNITGPGIDAPIFWSWENHSQTAATAPTQISLVAPRGLGRTVQVLATYQSGGMAFYYADRTLDFQGDNVAVDLILTNVVTTKKLVEGDITGRFLTGPNTGYTGPFHFRFAPPGRPSMIVHQGEMFSGWVERLFALSAPYLTYTKPDGTNLLPGLTNESLSFYSASQKERAARIRIPAAYENQSNQWVNGERTIRMAQVAAKRAIVGFFGDEALTAGKRVCFPASPTSSQISSGTGLTDIDRIYKTPNSSDPINGEPSNPIRWAGKTAVPVDTLDFAYIESLLLGAEFKGGGEGASCTEVGAEWENYLKVDPSRINDSPLSFRGPFRRVDAASGGDGLAKGTWDNNKLKIDWAYLPGVIDDLPGGDNLAGVRVFWRKLPDSAFTADSGGGENPYERELRAPGADGYRCDEFADSAKFSPAFALADVSGSATTSFELPLSVAEEDKSKYQIVVCPRGKDGRLFLSAVRVYLYNEGGGGVGGCMNCASPATKVIGKTLVNTLTSAAAPAIVNAGACLPIRLYGITSTGQDGFLNEGTSVTLQTSNAADVFYSNESCYSTTDDSGANPKTFNNVFSGRLVYLKTTRALASPEDVDVSIVPTGGYQGSVFYTRMRALSPATKMVTIVPSEIVRYSCNEISWQGQDADGNPSIPADWAHYFFNFPSNANLQFFNHWDHECSGPSVSGSIELGGTGMKHTTRTVRFRYSGPDAAVSLAPEHTTPPVTIMDAPVNVVSPGVPVRLSVNVANQMNAGDCTSVRLSLRDAQHHIVPVSSSLHTGGLAMTVALSATGGSFWADETCSSASISSTTMENGWMTSEVWFKPAEVAGASINVAPTNLATGVNITGSSVTNINVAAAVANRILVVLPGQSWDNSAKVVTGTPLNFIANEPVTIQLYALTGLGTVDTQFSDTSAVQLRDTSWSLNVDNMGAWSNGTATATVRFTSAYFGQYIVTGGTGRHLQQVSSSAFNVLFDQPATQWKVYGATAIARGCQPYLISLEDAAGVSRMANAPVVITVSNSETGASVADNSGCYSGAHTKTFTLSSGERSLLIYVNVSTDASNTITVSGGNYTNGQIAVSVTGAPSVSATHLTLWGSANAKVGQCMPLFVGTTDSAGSTANNSGGTVTLNSSAGGAFYQDKDCAFALSGNQGYLSGSFRVMTFFYKPGIAGAGASFSGVLNSLVPTPLSAVNVAP